MNWEIRNIFDDLEEIKRSFENLKTSHAWFIEEYFNYEELESSEDVKSYGYGYTEHYIHNKQLFDLMYMYIGELDKKIKEFKEIEKASSVKFGDRTDNA
ncbi:type II toxin-antitoxin system toxin TscT [Staphylococcus coagulans]|uniref:type II toxin-antitoxin system toxin TscT n=1 Tax=Staphylococcus coagulans TaxID=74706 RepID=UPI00336508A1